MANIRTGAGAKICAFCGTPITNKNISKEHVWPKWLRTYIPPAYTDTQHTGSVRSLQVYEGGGVRRYNTALPATLNRNGDPLSQTLRIVCKSCNNGWMSRIVNDVKPHLLPFTQGEWPRLSPVAIEAIATWSCLFTMVLEFAHLDTMATSPAQRRRLLESGRPPEDWIVWLGRYEGNVWHGAFNHFGLGGSGPFIGSVEDIPAATASIPRQQAQSTAFCLGSLFVFTFSGRDKLNIDADRLAADAGIRRVWPKAEGHIEPPTVILDDYTADQVSRFCLSPAERPHVRAVWESS